MCVSLDALLMPIPLRAVWGAESPTPGVCCVRAVAGELPSTGHGRCKQLKSQHVKKTELVSKILILNCNALLFCFDRRSKYSKAKQEADEEKHLNQGKGSDAWIF